ncbi:regulatory LuxR family protein [Prauserella shujinwangii]|uniref:Regulatory LuxR family protein n=1 Tax=Prauserella shujinwangii TaxID=1453103 RepID=A0A2T0LNH8_9PSEU|nr:LuxR C-terminal-related transcriptional regulator [Prauserella shujinwangii]PRX44661.1 regulatory LuxR family protein [Prauserella shujinwangii]
MIATQTELVLDEPTRELCAAVAAGRLAPARLAVVAPGGYGKTALLDHLAASRTRAGGSVAWFGEGTDGTGTADLVLVDAAHELGDAQLAELRRLAGDDRAGLVIAARPWPRPAELNRVLGRLRAQVVLRPFDRAQTRSALGREREWLTDFVHAETGGVPGFVTRLGHALAARPRREVPAAALTGFRAELDRMPPDVLRVLLAVDAGAGLDADLLGALLGREHDDVAELVDAARATGLLSHDGTLLPVAAKALRAAVPSDRRQGVARRLVRLQLERSGPVLPVVRSLLGAGLTGPELAKGFEAAAEEVATTEPALAARLYEAAVDAGSPPGAVGARWAELAARAGDLDTALRLADEVVAAGDAPDRAGGARVAGTALALRGQLARSAELFRWSGTTLSTVYAAIGSLGTGRLAEARQLLERPASGEPPTLLSGAMSATARALLDSVSATPTAALSALVSAAETLEPVARSALLPDSPAALGAVVGLHCGELGIAESLLERAIAAECGGGTLAARHRLLLAWIAMVRGDAELAGERLRAAGEELAPRDWLFAVGLRVGLARRASDLAALRLIWREACEAVIRHPADLFTILPFGEFSVAAARLGDRDRLGHRLRQVWDLLHALGDPPLWTVPLHWSGLHAAIIAERQDEARDHVAALAAGADRGPYFAAVASAAECWLRVIAGDVDAERVETAARGLHDAGLWWDAARLAGQAAIRTTDRKAMVALLDSARMLQGRPGPAAPGDAVAATTGSAKLSERELQVAELVVAGRTYKQVGDQLYISAKTVEHHMARMRQRLGATSRSDLLAQLRALLAARE